MAPEFCRPVPGMIHYAAAHARQIQREPDTFWLSRLRKGPGMQYVNSIFGELLKPIDRRQFREIVERHDGNAYDKSFKSWDHVVTMVGAQLGRVASLRAVEATVKANSHQHYHLGVGKAPRSTLSSANARRPVGVFAETFAMLAKKADRHTRVEGAEMVRLIDSSPVPLGKMCKWAEWNGRIRGMKMHVVYHPENDVPRCLDITPATVNDVEIGRQTELEAGATYVFDKGYYHFGWWKRFLSGIFRAGSLDPLARGCRRIWPARCCSTGSGRLDLDLLISGPRVNLVYQPYARGGADGQAVVCPLLRGSSPTRGVAPKQHRGLRRAFSPAFFGLVLLIPWRVGAEESGAAKDGFGRRDAARPARAAWI